MGYIMKCALRSGIVVVALFMSDGAWAHPVGFKGATMTMLGFEQGRYDAQVNHTFSRHLALGASYMRINYGDAAATFAFPQLNWLVKRWNRPNSQANIYLYGGVGYSNYNGKNGLGGLVGGEADYETLQFYTSLQQQSLLSTGPNLHRTVFKVGAAPYVADYDQLSTWLIAKVEYASYMAPDNRITFSPALRLMYKKWFLEGGSSFTGVWYVNVMKVF